MSHDRFPTLAISTVLMLASCAGTATAPDAAPSILAPMSVAAAPMIYQSHPQGPIDGSPNETNPATSSFDTFAMPLCVAMLYGESQKAREIWAQLMGYTGENARRWMPPGVGQ